MIRPSHLTLTPHLGHRGTLVIRCENDTGEKSGDGQNIDCLFPVHDEALLILKVQQ